MTKRDRWAKILNQRRPYAVPTVDEVVDDFRRRFAGGDASGTGPVGHDEARRYFGLGSAHTHDELRRAFKTKIFAVHPDRGGSEVEARRCVAMYEKLEVSHGR